MKTQGRWSVKLRNERSHCADMLRKEERRKSKMKKVMLSVVIVVFAAGFFVSGGEAEAMNNESAAMLAGAIAIFGRPVLQAVAGEIFPPAPAPAVIYTELPPYPAPAKVKRHNHRKYYRYCDGRDESAYERGWCEEWEKLEYRRGREDARESYYGERY